MGLGCMRGSIANSSFHPANFLAVSPGFRFTRLIPFTMSPERQFQMRRAKLLVLQHARLVERLAAQHFMPELFIQAPGFGRLVLKRLQIRHPRQRHRPAAGRCRSSLCSAMASVSSRPERKLDEHVTPRAAMMTARMNQRPFFLRTGLTRER